MRLAVLLALALSIVGCSDDLASEEASLAPTELSGSIRIPLVAQAEGGVTYRLRGATFEISGAAMMTLHEPRGHERDELVTELPPGQYNLYLRPGWEVIAIAADGTTSTGALDLVSKNPLVFSVNQLSDAALQLQFARGEQALTFGAGSPIKVTSAADDVL